MSQFVTKNFREVCCEDGREWFCYVIGENTSLHVLVKRPVVMLRAMWSRSMATSLLLWLLRPLRIFVVRHRMLLFVVALEAFRRRVSVCVLYV